jgi:hypothetical protein
MYSVSYWRGKNSGSTENVSVSPDVCGYPDIGKREAVFRKTSAKVLELRMKIRMKARVFREYLV